ncbi:hypothetical protein [Caballeronia sp. S22]|uniref:hypothetical protein n=1 Tax=Caballeronia sp. S22 TaxID=3137182 RepID=UPI003530A082
MKVNSSRFGRLIPLQHFKPRPKETIGLPKEAPVLTCSIEPTVASAFLKNSRSASFGFGFMELDDGQVMTIRLQLDGLQVYWIAPLTDPELWAAIDIWKRAGRAIILFDIQEAKRRHEVVCVIDMPRDIARHDVHRLRPDNAPSERTWQSMVLLAGSGMIQLQATSDIPGMPLRHVSANVLLTKRLETVVPKDDWHSRR